MQIKQQIKFAAVLIWVEIGENGNRSDGWKRTVQQVPQEWQHRVNNNQHDRRSRRTSSISHCFAASKNQWLFFRVSALECFKPSGGYQVFKNSLLLSHYSAPTTVSCYASYANKYSVQCRVASRSANRRLVKKNSVKSKVFFLVLFRFIPRILNLVKITFMKRDFYAEKSLAKVGEREKTGSKILFIFSFAKKKSPSHFKISNYDTSIKQKKKVRKFSRAKK